MTPTSSLLLLSALIAAFGVRLSFAQSTQPTPTASFAEFDRRAAAGEPLTVVYFGGSLTWGANATDPQRTSYRALMSEYLQKRYPKAPFTFCDAAIGGTGSKLGLFRLERDVLARRPDLVFLDFTCNDDLFGHDIPNLAAYEHLLRSLVARGIPVQQAFFGFKFTFGAAYKPQFPNRVLDHLKLSAAYHTAIGNAYPIVQGAITSGKCTIDQLWPIDGAHPDDPGYRLFFEAMRLGFEQAVEEKRVCQLPEKSLFPDLYSRTQRVVLTERGLPENWRREKAFRTSAWFDGLSSRWIGDVAVADAHSAAPAAPLELEFAGTLVGVLGEADDEGAGFEAFIDGNRVRFKTRQGEQDVWPFDTRAFKGRLLQWRELACELSPGKHTLKIVPVFTPGARASQLRIESVCVAGE